MRQCVSCNRPIEGSAAYCSFCQEDILAEQKRRSVRRLWIGFASLITAGGVWMVWTFWHSYSDPYMELFGGRYASAFNALENIGADPSTIHHRYPSNFVYINHLTLLFAWVFIVCVWLSIYRKKDPDLGDLQ